jgi:hypothetical protein
LQESGPEELKYQTPGMQRDLIKREILWQGNPISVVKLLVKTPVLCETENEWRS